MTYLNNEMKFVCIVNRKVPIVKLMNAIAHTANGLAVKAQTKGAVLLDYPNAADSFTSVISEAPYIILMAKNGNQLKTLREAAADTDLVNNSFISAMIGPNAITQQKQTLEAEGEGLEYWAVGLYGEADRIHPLTKRFSLYRPPS